MNWPRHPRFRSVRPDAAGRHVSWAGIDPRIGVVLVWISARLVEGRRRMREEPDAGYSTETVLVTALLVVAALVVIAIIVVKITDKANSINLG